ncbi:MAG: winged helix-turn-helix transcriptional regulator, partial [Rhodospirillaceae bacterium]|nr:winged helix-turn-helix transcriptional regulator [Rhodospirillaceae bacterium]
MLNETDKALLALVQQDATLSLAEMSEKVHLSTTPCWRRLQRLERDGYIARRVALLDPDRMNVPITVFVAVRT